MSLPTYFPYEEILLLKEKGKKKTQLLLPTIKMLRTNTSYLKINKKYTVKPRPLRQAYIVASIFLSFQIQEWPVFLTQKL